jgi:hypothetical protein
MTEREIRKCSKCEHYSYSIRRCKLGKINPPTIKSGVEAARFMGLSHICKYAKYYDKISDKFWFRVPSK